jgi:FkbM family methyltransferase
MSTRGVLTWILSFFGRRPVTVNDFFELQSSRLLLLRYEKIRTIASDGAPLSLTNFLLQECKSSKSQQLQDLLALFFSNSKPGFFVEFGATDGVNLSNTFILEKNHMWNGILAEPALVWRQSLGVNRNAQISFDCVYSKSGLELDFEENSVGELSAIYNFDHAKLRSHEKKIYKVTTISLNDLLEKFSAPNYIDFLSVDTEGSEFEILETFNFDKYKFGFISVEHNFTENENKIEDLLISHGYIRILPKASEFDGWYINPSINAQCFSH